MLSALTCPKGNLAGNLDAHITRLHTAAAQQCQVVVFPEMSLTGSVEPRARPDRLIDVDDAAVSALVAATEATRVTASFGIAERSTDGTPHITQLVAAGGRLVGHYRKRHLGEGEEGFTPGTDRVSVMIAGRTVGLAICAEAGVDFPFDDAVTAGADLVLFSAAPGLHGRRIDDDGFAAGLAWWQSSGLTDLRRHAKRTGCWIAVATQAGSTEDEEFPGLAALVDPTGFVVDRLPDWRAGDLVVEIPD